VVAGAQGRWYGWYRSEQLPAAFVDQHRKQVGNFKHTSIVASICAADLRLSKSTARTQLFLNQK
jgi:hypothetical protein